MSIQHIREDIIKQVGHVRDENILCVLDEKLYFYLEHKGDTASQLSEADYNELVTLANEPIEGNTISFDKFKAW